MEILTGRIKISEFARLAHQIAYHAQVLQQINAPVVFLLSCYPKTNVFNHARKVNINQVILCVPTVIVNVLPVLQQLFAHHAFQEEYYKSLPVNHHAALNSMKILKLKHVFHA